MFTTSISEIQYVRTQSNAVIRDVLHLLESSYATLAHGISNALEAEGNITGYIEDNHANEFVITIIPSPNTAIMPHCVEIEGIIYTADYAIRVLACCLADIEFVRITERLGTVANIS